MPDWLKTLLTNAVMGSWKTTAIGFTCGVLELVIPSLQAGKMPTAQQWILAAAAVFLGMFGKDHDKAGTGTTADPIRGPNSPPAQADPSKIFTFPSHTGDN